MTLDVDARPSALQGIRQITLTCKLDSQIWCKISLIHHSIDISVLRINLGQELLMESDVD